MQKKKLNDFELFHEKKGWKLWKCACSKKYLKMCSKSPANRIIKLKALKKNP
jgi:hypothetical protein